MAKHTDHHTIASKHAHVLQEHSRGVLTTRHALAAEDADKLIEELEGEGYQAESVPVDPKEPADVHLSKRGHRFVHVLEDSTKSAHVPPRGADSRGPGEPRTGGVAKTKEEK